ncbi:hypothetical protein J3Q64DRAFT_1715716 [Phycomyces blakesleeanus]|uniref:Homeodomain-like DNA binding domain-containing transcription factor n=1 Tax=Phycomyces blakesleeanus TaxID=4837 RepID=A0ABR3BGQ2_PHYBL
MASHSSYPQCNPRQGAPLNLPPLFNTMHFYPDTPFGHDNTTHPTHHLNHYNYLNHNNSNNNNNNNNSNSNNNNNRSHYILPPPASLYHQPYQQPMIPYMYPTHETLTPIQQPSGPPPKQQKRRRRSDIKAPFRYKLVPFQTRQSRKAQKEEDVESPPTEESAAAVTLVSFASRQIHSVESRFGEHKQQNKKQQQDTRLKRSEGCAPELSHSSCLQRHQDEEEDRRSMNTQQSQILEAAQILMNISSCGMRMNAVH